MYIQTLFEHPFTYICNLQFFQEPVETMPAAYKVVLFEIREIDPFR